MKLGKTSLSYIELFILNIWQNRKIIKSSRYIPYHNVYFIILLSSKNVYCVVECGAREERPDVGAATAGRAPAVAHLPGHGARVAGGHRGVLHAAALLPARAGAGTARGAAQRDALVQHAGAPAAGGGGAGRAAALLAAARLRPQEVPGARPYQEGTSSYTAASVTPSNERLLVQH